MPTSEDQLNQAHPPPVSPINNVLVVEDEYQLAEWLAEILTHENYYVDVVANGMDALERFGSTIYDAVICDIMMPRINGEAFYNEVVRRQPYLADKFIFITGQVNIGAGLADFATRGGNLLIGKPFDVVAICEALDELAQR